jgi:uncharacterized protein YebE (UPF0316 family)
MIMKDYNLLAGLFHVPIISLNKTGLKAGFLQDVCLKWEGRTMEIMLIILVINVIYVSFLTVRMILTLKGQKYLASAISTFEVCIYVIGLGLVLENLNEIQNLIAYAVGYGLGILVGSKIEEWMALGYVTVQVISNRYDQPLPQILRQAGYGVTSWIGQGKDGPRLVMEILARRKNQQDLYQHILAYDEKAFIITHEPRHFHGGFWVRSLKNRELAEESIEGIWHDGEQHKG